MAAEAREMTKVIDACTVPAADSDAPQHQKVPDPAADADDNLCTAESSNTPPHPRERTAAQRKRDRKKGKNRRLDNNPAAPPPPPPEQEDGDDDDEESNTDSTSSPDSSFHSSMPPPPSAKKAAAAAAAAASSGKIVPLFVASIGNPPPTYAHTLHSAGHTLLEAVRDLRAFPPWQKDRLYANGLVSRQAEAGVSRNFSWTLGLLGGKKANGPGERDLEGEEDWTLWQSPSLMNVSGKALAQAFGRWKRVHAEGQLVVVHDELERGLGKVSVRRGVVRGGTTG
ncbi:hypothetical protein B0J12DRAFT_382767 [Macrophomina phaseolina]|uniref:Peptidyl-tRNA hydrolase n=1 Tax=Macrophomina phaseolina TaxID=35725 RepID=A0ABQ8GKZ5_9PEZI|nr:hypothetical protein B0J12DRAFT_382767 [Macrophomina phaseolina]